MDFADQSEFLLTVASTPVNLALNSKFNVDSLDVSYDGKQLLFTEITSGYPQQKTFDLNDDVTLRMDFGSGLTHYFRGKIRAENNIGQNHSEGVQYTAIGMKQLANEIILNTDGFPQVIIEPTIYCITDGNAVSTFVGTSVSSAVGYLFTLMSSELGLAGIPATIGTPGTEVFSSFLLATHEFTNATFISAVEQVIAQEPAIRLFFDDTQNKWIFVNLVTCSVHSIVADSDNLLSLDFTRDLNNRYTAVQLVSQQIINLVAGDKVDVALTASWIASLQDDWCIPKALGVSTLNAPVSEYAWVYRRWSIPSNVGGVAKNTPTFFKVPVDYWGQGTQYINVDASIDWDNGVVIARVPVVFDGDPYNPGHAKGPSAAYLTYYPSNLVPYTDYPNLRIPSSGFEGSAFTQYGIQSVKRMIVDLDKMSNQYAQDVLDLHKDVVISGSLPLDGDPNQHLINLQRRITVAGTPYPTGLETLGAIYTSYSYKFGKRGQNTINLSTDMSAVIRTG